MALKDTIRVVQPSQRRLKIFVDFWNVVINARNQCDIDIEVHWDRLSDFLVSQTVMKFSDESAGTLAGCYIFGSYTNGNAKDIKFKNEVLDKFGTNDGLYFDFRERINKESTHKCQGCGQPVARFSEAGVDVSLAVEMIKHAHMRDHDYLALVSSDQDFLPALQYLKDMGQRVMHVAPGQPHRDMRAATWKQISLRDAYQLFTSIRAEERLILTTPQTTEKTEDAKTVLSNSGLKFRVIDISKKEDISDKDLLYIINNLRIRLYRAGDRDYDAEILHFDKIEDMYRLRKKIFDGEIVGDFPCIISDGKIESYFDTNRKLWTNQAKMFAYNFSEDYKPHKSQKY